MATDLELADRWRDGDEAAGEELLERHRPSLLRFFSNKVTSGAEDLVQQTFLRCVERKEQFRRDASFRTYLFVVARNLLVDRLRKQTRRPDAVDFAEVSLADLGTSPSSAVARDERHRALLEALEKLPLDFQIAVELTYWEGLNATEVGEILGVSPNTIRSRLVRARTALDAHLPDLIR